MHFFWFDMYIILFVYQVKNSKTDYQSVWVFRFHESTYLIMVTGICFGFLLYNVVFYGSTQEN